MMRRGILFAFVLAFLLPFSVTSAEPFDPFSANIEENIATPGVNPKAHGIVADAMSALTRMLRQAGYNAVGVRNGEVTMVTVAASDLFAPNSTALKSAAASRLSALIPYVRHTDRYKVIIAVHSDDTGDDTYAENITGDRANAVDDYFASHMGGNSQIIPYGLGYDEPVAPNTGVSNRARNRRVEIYFVPTQEYINHLRRK